jgi:hypothetical protein
MFRNLRATVKLCFLMNVPFPYPFLMRLESYFGAKL